MHKIKMNFDEARFILSMYVNDNIDYYLEMDDDEKAFIDALNYVLDYIHKNQ